MRVTKQLNALITTIIFFNLLFFILALCKLNVLYWNIIINLILLIIYKLIYKYRTYINTILEAKGIAKQLNNALN